MGKAGYKKRLSIAEGFRPEEEFTESLVPLPKGVTISTHEKHYRTFFTLYILDTVVGKGELSYETRFKSWHLTDIYAIGERKEKILKLFNIWVKAERAAEEEKERQAEKTRLDAEKTRLEAESLAREQKGLAANEAVDKFFG